MAVQQITHKKIIKHDTSNPNYRAAPKPEVEVDGNVEKKTNSFKTAEEFYDAECVKKHSDNHGRLVIGKHHLINNVATSQSDYPTDSSTKAEIQAFYDVRNINYSASDTKAELLSRIEVNDFTGAKSIKK